MEIDEKVRQKIEKWKRDLLDFSMRNRLINFRYGKTSTLKLLSPPLNVIFETLAVRERVISFVPAPPQESGNFADDFSGHLKSGQVLTEREEKEMNLVLNRLRLKSRTSYEEMGINTLFMVFGLLKWRESSASQNHLLSPLLLVPVTIGRDSIASPYTVRMIDEEIVLNPTLCEKLEEFGLNLAVAFEKEMFIGKSTLSGVFAKISEIITPLSGWSIVEEAVIGVFSFAKLSMYKDLENYQALVYNNPVLKSIAAGSTEAIKDGDSEFVEDLDKAIDPVSSYQILDADSSQQEAILAVKAGRNLVIQGPPGTGKSQTIANIIAECLSLGRRVLFVSEKMAALEVVKRRLDGCGLGDFCLELHSRKTGKRTVLNELDRVLTQARQHAVDTDPLDRELVRLRELRTNLNQYVEALHRKRSNLGISAFEVHGKLAALDDVKSLSFRYENTGKLHREGMDSILHDLDQAKRYAEIYRDYRRSPLNAVRADGPDALLVIRIRESLEALNETIQRLDSLGKCEPEGAGKLAESLSRIDAPLDVIVNRKDPFHPTEKKTIESASVLIGLIGEIERILPSKYRGQFLQAKRSLQELVSSYEALIEKRARVSEITRSQRNIDTMKPFEETVNLLTRYRTGILSLDHDELVGKFKGQYHSWLGRLFGWYRKKVELLRSLTLNGQRDISNIVEDLEMASRVASRVITPGCVFEEGDLLELLLDSRERLLLHYRQYDKVKAELEHLTGALSELADLLSFVGLIRVHSEHESDMPAMTADLWLDSVSVEMERLKTQLVDISAIVDISVITRGESIGDYKRATGFIRELTAASNHLQEWLLLKRSVERLKRTGLEDFLERAFEEGVDPADLREVFLKGFYSRLLSLFYGEDTILNSFSGIEQNILVEEFRRLDIKQQHYARKRLASLLAQKIPVSDFARSGSAETSILKREAAKKRRNKSIRRLFSEIPNLLQVLKPCMMMSPLSVSVFIDPERFRFDLVIFDEASQVFPEDSVGAIMRADQVVIVGDNKQLPPTSFFKISEPDVAELEEEESDLESLESILDECSTAGLTEKKLLWHYRSRHESLIAFSNHHFYENRLNTFPSSTFDCPGCGISMTFVDNGVYDRAKSRKNQEEALRVATIVMDHARCKPTISLGVVAFSEAQQMAIIDRLELLRREDPSLEEFFKEESPEPFFVKNLENVQGDERDEMIFSIGYGRDHSGRLTMNFGPLNKNGGERRLNVAITRARQKVTVVSSIKAGDIPADVQTPGVLALREYLNFAESGGRGLHGEKRNWKADFDSPFEEEVYRELTECPLTVHSQVGCSSYRIDLAVVDDRRPGKYLLGIECDGAMYHSARTARDRDRLRQQVLENLGWKITRVWSRDWIFDRKAERDRLLSEIEKARSNLNVESEVKTTETIPEENLQKLGNDKPSLPVYERFNPSDLTELSKSAKLLSAGELIKAVLEKEAPVHLDEVVSRILGLYENHPALLPAMNRNMYTKSGSISRKRLKQYLLFHLPKEKYELDGDFILNHNETVLPRRAAGANARKADHIPPVEVREAIRLCLKDAFSMNREDLKTDVSKLFGFGRLGTAINELIDKEIEFLIQNGQLESDADRLSLSDGAK
jgi:very-short-patch-repair endonuclease